MFLDPRREEDTGYSYTPDTGKISPPAGIVFISRIQEEHPHITQLRKDFESIIAPYIKSGGVFDRIVVEHTEDMRKKVLAVFQARCKKINILNKIGAF